MAISTFEERHDLRKAHLFSPSKIYAAQYVHPDFIIRTKKQSGEIPFFYPNYINNGMLITDQ